ncbi:protein HGV2-like [Babylonia areolata]|uniref:protein HGV2-like n=1 Tax=Babylonia areolata TaxID=304850 RepID=UPI003FD4EF89
MSSEAGEGTSTSASPKKEQMDAQEKAQELLAQGKRNLICQEIPTAVQQFQDACQILSSAFGEMAKECAGAYFNYGSALLDLSRMEQDVLGNALEGVDVDADDEGGPNNKDQFEPPDKVDGATSKDQAMDDTEEGEEEEGDEEEEEEGEEEGEGAEEAGSQEDEDPDDVSNLQLSWEMLELAKIIYSKDSSKVSQLKAAEAHLKLGEVSLESEQYEQAISDLESCLEIQKKHLDSCDRAIAETYYQLGLACQMSKQLDKAKESFASAVTCLETKMEKLKAIVEEKPAKSPSQTMEPAESAQQEITEILDILPEIKEKIRDAEDENKSMEDIKNMAKQAMGTIFSAIPDSTSETGFAGTSSKSPVKSTEPQKTMDISHLIRKKRKPEEEEKKEEEDLENKKQKQEGGSGDSGVNGVHEKTDGKPEPVAAT